MVGQRAILQVLFYFVFGIFALMFLEQTIQEFLQKRTSYSVKYEPTTLQDLPTVLVCVGYRTNGSDNLIYSKDISIDVRIFGKQSEENWTLSLDGIVKTSQGLQIELRDFWQTRFLSQHCYKISSKWNQNTDVDIKNFRMQLMTKYLNQSIFVGHNNIFISSEENIYGVSWYQFYDGKFKRIENEGGRLVGGKCRVLYISGVTEYRNLEDFCSQDSFYLCLARRFATGQPLTLFFDFICKSKKPFFLSSNFQVSCKLCLRSFSI